MKRLFALVAACAAAFAALPLLAVDLAFPMTGGNGDLASGDAWSPYAWSDIAGKRILFANGTTTYTMSTNCTFSAFCLSNSANATVTFDLSNGVTNTLTGSGGLRLDPTGYRASKERNNRTIFKGGVWDFSGVGGFTFNQGQSYGWKESLLLDGATWTNLTSFSGMNYGNQDNSIILTNGASVTAADGYISKNLVIGGRFFAGILAGSRLTVTSSGNSQTLLPSADAWNVNDHTLLVSGPGSALTWKFSNSSCYLSALASGGSPTKAKKALFRVEKEATVSIAGELKCLSFSASNWTDGAWSNRLEVLSGASMSVAGNLRWPASSTAPAHDNTILVSNATLNCGSLLFGGKTNMLQLVDATLTTGNSTVEAGSGHRFEIDNSGWSVGNYSVNISGETTIVLKGKKPRVTGNGFHGPAKTTLVFEFPLDGAGDFSKPIFSFYTGVKLDYLDTHVLSFPNLTAFRKTLTQNVEIPLFASSLDQTDEQKGVRIPAAVLASANLPEWASFKQTGKSLTLCVKKPPKGLSIIFR